MTANNAIIAQLATDNLPVVFVDTCCILDVVNSIHLKELPENYGILVNELLSINKTSINLITCDTVETEWNNNIKKVLSTLEQELIKTDRNISTSYNLLNKLLQSTYSIPANLKELNVQTHIGNLSETFLNQCIKLEHSNQHGSLAMSRMLKHIAPAKKGKSEPGDCLIIETFLDMCEQLRTSGFDKLIIFFTANKSDFGTHGKLISPLDAQFDAYGAILINHINHLLSFISLQAPNQA